MSEFKVFTVASFNVERTRVAYEPIPARAPLQAFMQGWSRISCPAHVVANGATEILTSPVRALVGNSVRRGSDGDENYSGGVVPYVTRGLTKLTTYIGAGIGASIGWIASPLGMLYGISARECADAVGGAGNHLGLTVGRAASFLLEAAAGAIALCAHALAIAAGFVPLYFFPLPYITAALLCTVVSLCGVSEKTHAYA